VNRRNFIRAGASTLLLPVAMTSAYAAASAAGSDYFFFDERFPRARVLAAALAGRTRPQPVHADVTDLWRTDLERACRRTSLTLRGVTTESFHFCLKILAGEHARVDTEIARVGRDLFLWTIETHVRARANSHG